MPSCWFICIQGNTGVVGDQGQKGEPGDDGIKGLPVSLYIVIQSVYCHSLVTKGADGPLGPEGMPGTKGEPGSVVSYHSYSLYTVVLFIILVSACNAFVLYWLIIIYSKLDEFVAFLYSLFYLKDMHIVDLNMYTVSDISFQTMVVRVYLPCYCLSILSPLLQFGRTIDKMRQLTTK